MTSVDEHSQIRPNIVCISFEIIMIVLEFKQVNSFFSIFFYFHFYLFLCFTCENFVYWRLEIWNRQVKFWRGDFLENFGKFSSKNLIFTDLLAIFVQYTCDQSLKNMKLCVRTQTPPKPKTDICLSWSTTRLTCQFVKY